MSFSDFVRNTARRYHIKSQQEYAAEYYKKTAEIMANKKCQVTDNDDDDDDDDDDYDVSASDMAVAYFFGKAIYKANNS